MIKNPKVCWWNVLGNNFYNNGRFHLKVINETNVCIRVIIQYTLAGQTITKESKYITKDQTANLNFTTGAVNVCFNIINYSLPTHPIICNHCIATLKDTCYAIRGTPQQPVCVPIY